MYKPNVSVAFPESENKIQKKQEKNSTKSRSKYAGTSRNAPIDIWWDLIQSDNAQIEIEQRLRQVYKFNLPTLVL